MANWEHSKFREPQLQLRSTVAHRCGECGVIIPLGLLRQIICLPVPLKSQSAGTDIDIPVRQLTGDVYGVHTVGRLAALPPATIQRLLDGKAGRTGHRPGPRCRPAPRRAQGLALLRDRGCGSRPNTSAPRRVARPDGALKQKPGRFLSVYARTYGLPPDVITHGLTPAVRVPKL